MSNNDYSQEIQSHAQARPVNKAFLAFLVLFIIPISGLSIDIYVPSLPAVSHYFGVDISLVQLTITAYMVGLGVMQLFSGPISDSYGRRKPFLGSMFFYILATLLIPFATSIELLLLLRFIQGIMVAIMVVPLRAIFPDLFEGKEYYKMINYMTMAWSIGPIIAPVIGGYLQFYMGWKTNFYFLTIYSLLAFILNFLYLPDTSKHHHAFHLRQILKRYKNIMTNKIFITSVLTNGLLYSIIILFAIVAPFLMQTVLHYNAVQFGQVALLSGLAWFVGGIIGRFLLHIPHAVKSKYVFWSMLIVAISFLILDLFFTMNIYLIVLPILLLEVFGAIIFSSNFARGVALFPEASGSANALFGGFIFLISGMTSGLGTLLKTTTILPLGFSYVAIVMICLGLNSLAYDKVS